MRDSSSITGNANGRPPVKKQAIVAMLHRQIISGQLAPGSQLPTRRELVSQFGGSFLSVQQALNQLIKERFVEARGPAGTFVCDRPPHLYEYALIFPHTTDNPSFRRFWIALHNEAQRLNRDPKATRHITSWFGIDGHADNEDFQQLNKLVQRHQLAGLIFASSPHLLRNTSLLDHPGIPRAAIVTPNDNYVDVTMVCPDTNSFLTRAIDHLVACGRRHIAVISIAGTRSNWYEKVASVLQSRGVMTKPYWNLQLDPSTGSAVRHVAHLLMHPDQFNRPDALIISDDNLVEPVTLGLVDAGVRVPENLEIVAHCNFPWPNTNALPVTRLGFDANEVLAACLNAVDQQRQSKSSHSSITIQARFENEVPIAQEVCQ